MLFDCQGIDATVGGTCRSNPLALAVEELVLRAPLVHRKAWRHRADVSPEDREVLLSLQGQPVLTVLMHT